MFRFQHNEIHHNMKKKLILAIAIITLNCNIIFAQGYKYNISSNDGFFSTNNWEEPRSIEEMPNIINNNKRIEEAPIGNALFLLAGMGLAYGMIRRLKAND